MFLSQPPVIASLSFAVQLPLFPGKLILVSLLVLSVMAWVAIVTKALSLRKGQRADEKFNQRLRESRTTLEVFEEGWTEEASLHHDIYLAGAKEAAFQLLGSRDPGPAVHARMKSAGGMDENQILALREAFRRGERNACDRLHAGLTSLRAISIGALFLGVMALSWTLMRGFTVATDFALLAPWISGGLFFLFLATLVAMPASLARLFFLAHNRRHHRRLETFRVEIGRLFERSFAAQSSRDTRPGPDAEQDAPAAPEPPESETVSSPDEITMTYRGQSGKMTREFQSIRDSIFEGESESDDSLETAGAQSSW